MNQNYHKRLGSYLSEPKLGLRKASSEHSYITAAKAKYLNNSKHINYRYNPNFHHIPNSPSSPTCPQCANAYHDTPYACLHTTNLQYQSRNGKKYNPQPTQPITSQYYSPEIKTIRNALLDIRDQMKYANKNKYSIDRPTRRQQTGQAYQQANQRLNRFHEHQLNNRIEEKAKRNRELELKIDELQAAVEELNIRNKELQDDKWRTQNKISEYERQVQEQRTRANRAENDRNRIMERERALEISIMELKADLMTKEQILRELNFNQEQHRQMEITKRLMLGKSDEVSMLVNAAKETYSRGCQTNLSEVDIQNGYRELNQMQDHLCERINRNVKTQTQIHARMKDIEERMRIAQDILYRVQYLIHTYFMNPIMLLILNQKLRDQSEKKLHDIKQWPKITNNLNPSICLDSECLLYQLMSQGGGNFQLQFYIKLTQIIGRTFTELQELLTNQLKRQQHQTGNSEPTLPPQNQALALLPSLPPHEDSPNLQSNKSNEQDINQQQIKHNQIKQDTKIRTRKARAPKVSKFVEKKKKILKRRKLTMKKTNMEKLKVQNKLKKDNRMRSKKDAQESGKPYPPLNAFMLFLKENKHDIMKKKPELSPSQVSKYASTLWNEFSDSEKEAYLKIYRKNHEQYLQDLKAFQQKSQKQKLKSIPKVKFNQNSQSNQKERSESSYELNEDKSKENGNIRLRDNLRSRSHRKKQQSGEIICLESEVEEIENDLAHEEA